MDFINISCTAKMISFLISYSIIYFLRLEIILRIEKIISLTKSLSDITIQKRDEDSIYSYFKKQKYIIIIKSIHFSFSFPLTSVDHTSTKVPLKGII